MESFQSNADATPCALHDWRLDGPAWFEVSGWHGPCTGVQRMRIAIPEWQGRVSPVFDVAGILLLVNLEDGREISREEVRMSRADVASRIADLNRLGVDVLVCGAISAALEARLTASGVRIIGFICGAVEEVLAGFISGDLTRPEFVMPGCRRSYGERTGRSRAQASAGTGNAPVAGKETEHRECLGGDPSGPRRCRKDSHDDCRGQR